MRTEPGAQPDGTPQSPGALDPVPPLWLRALGPLGAMNAGNRIDLGPYKQRVLLAALLCRANTVVGVDRLLDVVWDDRRPPTARKNLQVYVSALRKIIGRRISHHTHGYMLHVTASELDLLRFARFAADGRQARHAGDLSGGRRLLGEAVRLWRDDPLADVVANPHLARESERLTNQCLAVYEDWVGLEIEAGRHLDVLPRLTELAERHPLRERLAIATMAALDRGGDRAAALARYDAHRQLLARELGLDPSPELRRRYQEILAMVPAPSRAGAAPSTVPGRLRPAQLPRDLPDFVGRTEQAEALAAALTSGARHTDVAVISGPAGIGKTALAVHVGHRVADRFPDGCLFASLSGDDGTPRPWPAVLAELMRGTGFDHQVPDEPAVAVTLWRSWIADRRILLLLDDAASEPAVRPLLPGGGASRTLVTGSRRLTGLESVHRTHLSGLSRDEVTTILGRALGAGRLAGADDAIDRIMAASGGLPLMVRAVVTKLIVLRHLPIDECARRLATGDQFLDDLAVGGVSLRTRLARFADRLPSLVRQAYQRIGALGDGSIGHDAAIAALADLPLPADRLIEELIEAGVLDPDDTAEDAAPAPAVSYRMPTLAHRFAAAERAARSA